jgi:hypothetical protein
MLRMMLEASPLEILGEIGLTVGSRYLLKRLGKRVAEAEEPAVGVPVR